MIKQTYPVGMARLTPQIRCVPVDTNVLLKNIARDVYQQPRPTGLRLLMDSGTLRLYAAVHIRDEVEEKMDAWMVGRGRDPEFARRIWREHYLSHLWFVDTGTLGVADPRVQAVLARDPDDAPTAALASVLGVHALSEDNDLVDYGLACGQPWLDVIFAAGHVALGEVVDFGLAIGVTISAQTVGDAARAVQSLASTPGGKRMIISAGVVTVGLLVLVVLVCAFDEDKRKWLTEKTRRAGEALASGGRASVGAYTRLCQNRFKGATRLEAAAVAAAGPLGDVDKAARILATERGSLSTKELARRLWAYKRVPTSAARYLDDQLSTCPAFVEVATGEWQFGRRSWN